MKEKQEVVIKDSVVKDTRKEMTMTKHLTEEEPTIMKEEKTEVTEDHKGSKEMTND